MQFYADDTFLHYKTKNGAGGVILKFYGKSSLVGFF